MQYLQYYEYLDEASLRRLTGGGRQLSPPAQRFLEKLDARFAPLTERQRNFVFHWENDIYEGVKKGLTPADCVRKEMPWLLECCILPRFHEALFWALDHCVDWPFTLGWQRRPFHSTNLLDHYYKLNAIIQGFARFAPVDADLCDILTGQLPEEDLAYTRECGPGYTPHLIAWALDQGNPRLEEILAASLNGETGIRPADRDIFLGIQMSRCEKLQDHLGRLLMVAKLQEGLRQSICECADEGTVPAFGKILQVIDENNLIRFSSVRRAVGAWTGLVSETGKGAERISEKSLALLNRTLSNPAESAAMLTSEDSMEIYMGLWGEAIRDVREGIRRAEKLAANGTRHQAAVCAFFAHTLTQGTMAQGVAGEAMAHWPEDREIWALALPVFELFENLISAQHNWKRKENQFVTPEDGKRFYPLMKAQLQSLKGKDAEVRSTVIPGESLLLKRSSLARMLCVMALYAGDETLQDEVLQYLPLVDPDWRSRYMAELLTPLTRPAQQAALFNSLADKSASTRKEALKIAEEIPPEQLDFTVIEEHLRKKGDDLREGCVRLLLRQNDEALMDTVQRLLTAPNAQKRAGGLDLVLQIAADEKRSSLKPHCAALLDLMEPKNAQEELLWDTARRAAGPALRTADPAEALFSGEDRYKPDIGFLWVDPCYRETFSRLFPDSRVFVGAAEGTEEDCPSCAAAREDLRALNALMEEHKEDPIGRSFTSDEEQLLGYGYLNPVWSYERSGIPFPDAEVWEGWYNRLGSPERLIRAILLLLSEASPADGQIDCFLGAGFSRPEPVQYQRNAVIVCAYLFRHHCTPGDLFQAGMLTAGWLTRDVPEESLIWLQQDRQSFFGMSRGIAHLPQFSWLLYWTTRAPADQWISGYAVREAFARRFEKAYRDYLSRMNGSDFNHLAFNRYEGSGYARAKVADFTEIGKKAMLMPTVADDLLAVQKGVIPKQALLYQLFRGGYMRKGLEELSNLSLFVRTREGGASATPGRGMWRQFVAMHCQRTVEDLLGKAEGFSDEEWALLHLADHICGKISDALLEHEIKRGDIPTDYSQAITGLRYVQGVNWLGRLLAALDGEPLQRAVHYYSTGTGRTEVLCYLLSVCIPGPEDSAATLETAVKRHCISERRLIETAMYNSAWVSLIGEHLHWSGFTAAVYFFIAHMNESFDEERMSVISRFTPLSAEELNGGAFDIDWFRSVWEDAGEVQFAELYDAARYITDNARHMRARKYADAALGRLDVEETEETIQAKRDKDLLMAYALIPLKDDRDLLRRFQFIQRFLKESRQFGATRSTNERKAAEMALVNLAVNSGDRDATRLTLRMEGFLAQTSLPLFAPQPVEDVTVHLACDSAGGVTLLCEKDGKPLKSVPVRLKKHPEILQITGVKKELTEQYRRCRRFLEEAMTNRTPLTSEEVRSLRANPVAQPLVDGLVFTTEDRFGQPGDDGLTDPEGRCIPWSDCTSLLVAHPIKLYRAGVWPAWQRHIFDKQMIQPFRQVFRELYVKTQDEEDGYDSLRYAGHQLQPKKTMAVLRSRRWSAGMEEGLQKVFYKDNLVAVLLARADWFTPAEMEAPTLESVRFCHRLTGMPVKIHDVPDEIFSEIMRDVDLAVSVAFVGGVDPEASHSTIEMRSALLSFTLPLFGITNVRIEKHHAIIQGKLGSYTVHLGSGITHLVGGPMLRITAVHSQHRGRLFLPFADDDPQTAEILTKVLFLAEDHRIRDPGILNQIR